MCGLFVGGMGKVQVSARLNESEWLIAGSKRLSCVWIKRVKRAKKGKKEGKGK